MIPPRLQNSTHCPASPSSCFQNHGELKNVGVRFQLTKVFKFCGLDEKDPDALT